MGFLEELPFTSSAGGFGEMLDQDIRRLVLGPRIIDACTTEVNVLLGNASPLLGSRKVVA